MDGLVSVRPGRAAGCGWERGADGVKLGSMLEALSDTLAGQRKAGRVLTQMKATRGPVSDVYGKAGRICTVRVAVSCREE